MSHPPLVFNLASFLSSFAPRFFPISFFFLLVRALVDFFRSFFFSGVDCVKRLQSLVTAEAVQVAEAGVY